MAKVTGAKKTGVQGGPVQPPSRPWSAEEMAAAVPLPIPAPPSDIQAPDLRAPDRQPSDAGAAGPEAEPPAATRHVAAGSGGQTSGGGRPEEA